MEERKTAGSIRNQPNYNSDNINRAVERAVRNPEFISYAVGQLDGLQFPAFKDDIIKFLKSKDSQPDVISLFESLDGYIQFRDQYHVQKALEENSTAKKLENQISDETRTRPNVRTRQTGTDLGIKEREVADDVEERKDYPEVPPSAMKVYICDICGKQFQNPEDLERHRKFEAGTAE
jgi:hypothetical protein